MSRVFCFTVVVLLTQVWLSSSQAIHGDETPEKLPPIRVGVLHSLTGTMAISELSLVDATEMAIDEINARGGVLGRPLESVIEDGESDSDTFAAMAQKLIVEDKVVSIFGCWTSPSRVAVRQVVEQHNNLLWYPVQYEGQEQSPSIIYSGAVPNQQIIPAVDWCRREFGTRMFLVGSDYLFPRTANEIIKLRLEAFDASPVGEEYVPLGSRDFDDIVAMLEESRPDVVLNTINGDSNGAFFAAFHAAGLTHEDIPVMSFSIAEDELRQIGVDPTVGHFCSWNYFQTVDTPANRRFVREFRKRNPGDRVTDDPIEAAYFQVHLFAKAVEAAGTTDIDAIRRAARGMIFAAPGGLVRIDPENQHTWKVSRIGQVRKDGQFDIVWSSEDPLPPRPFLPETFLAKTRDYGTIMFESISRMIDLEIDQPADTERKRLLGHMADVRGYLGAARTSFRSATLLPQPVHRAEFEQAWQGFEQRLTDLSARQEQLTKEQHDAFEQFHEARREFSTVATEMFRVLYPQRGENSEVPR